MRTSSKLLEEAREIFHAALDEPDPHARYQLVVTACRGQIALQQEVERLLDLNQHLDGFMECPALSTTALDEVVTTLLPCSIGPYKLLEKIGEGGMGVVYMAEQREPVRRTVALKVIKPGMDTHQVVARFEAERQALAMMNHPNIAKVLDAGATEFGLPYFVMELVKGVPITEFCDQQKLDNRQRLGLFINICVAIQHAHQKGLIHRDIKPSNLLVEMHDVTPVPKVIDFGVARAIGQQLTEKTLHTGFHQLIGTPLYMSPEQAGLSSIDVDTRSDVYSLGVLLYELLTGHTPFESETLRKAGFEEMRRIICEVDPPSPSVRVSTLQAKDQSTVSSHRGVDVRRISKSLSGELDWIVMKALEKDRNRRYDSPASLAADIQRYLNDEPVQAGPPSTLYRIQKFARRNRGLIATGSLFAATLLVGSVVGVWLAVEALNARNKAEASLRRESVARNQTEESFRIARQSIEATTRKIARDPRLQQKNFIELRKDLLIAAVPFYERLSKQKTEDRRLQIEMGVTLMDLADLHGNLGDMDAVCDDYQRTIELFDALARSNPNEPEVEFYLTRGHLGLGNIYANMGKMEIAEPELQTAMKRIDTLVASASNPESRHLQALVSLNLGQFLSRNRRFEEAEQKFRRAIATWQETPPPTETAIGGADIFAMALNALGVLQAQQQRIEEAEQSFSASCAEYYRLIALQPREQHGLKRGLSQSLENLALTLSMLGKQAEVLAAERESHEIIESLIKEFPNVPDYQVDLGAKNCNIGVRLLENGSPGESLPYFERAIASLQTVLAQDSRIATARQFLANSYAAMAKALTDLQRPQEAIIAYDKAIEWVEDSRKDDFICLKATTLAQTQPEKAIAMVEELLQSENLPPHIFYNAACVYSRLPTLNQDAPEPERYAQRALQLLTQARNQGHFSPPVIAHFMKDSDFDSLRSRADFQAFEQSLLAQAEESSAAQ